MATRSLGRIVAVNPLTCGIGQAAKILAAVLCDDHNHRRWHFGCEITRGYRIYDCYRQTRVTEGLGSTRFMVGPGTWSVGYSALTDRHTD